MGLSILLDDVIDATRILDRIGGKSYHHIRGLARGMDMHISESKYRLKYPCRMCIHFLNSIEWTLGYGSREGWYLVDPDHARARDDEEVEFIIDPVEEDKCQEYDPIERDSSPKESTSKKLDNRSLEFQKNSGWDEESDEVEKMKYEDNPVPMEGEDYMFVLSEEGDVFFFDHVIWGSLR